MDTTLHLDCSCHSPEHTLRFEVDEEEGTIYTSVYLNQHRNIFKRIWVAIKYVFGYKSRYGDWDCFSMKQEDGQRLVNFIESGRLRGLRSNRIVPEIRASWALADKTEGGG